MELEWARQRRLDGFVVCELRTRLISLRLFRYKPLKNKSRQQQRDFLRSRNGLLNWAEKHCVFCGNKSSRSAILMNGLRCCTKCDREQWPDKITKTEARSRYDLKDEHLLPSSLNSPTAAKLLQKHPGLPKVRYGTYISSNVPTTMFLRKDVEALAKLAHGDLKEHLARKAADRDERRKRARETKARKDAEAEAEKAKRQRVEHAELVWTYRHKHHSITSYGDEAGPSTPPQLIAASSSSGERTAKKHNKTLSIDSDAANEGRVITPPQKQEEFRAVTPGDEAVVRVNNYAMWDDLPSMFGLAGLEWDAFIEDHYPPSPPRPSIEKKGKSDVLEAFGTGRVQGGEMVALC